MSSGPALIRLRHGSTRRRAEAILRDGPDPTFKEPGGLEGARGFSTARIHGPYPTGSPEDMAARKARLFPDEGGPAIIEMDVPEAIVRMADLGGEVRFDPGFGLEELLAAWRSLPKRILTP
jgi:hypothetical protein